jgi:FkbM family methyltransferase
MALKIENLIAKYNLNISGLIHVGIHYGEEHLAYLNLGIKNLLYFEADPNNYEVCKEFLEKNDSQGASIKLLNKALGDDNKILDFNLASNDSESSSFLKPKLHLSQYPWIKFDSSIKIQSYRLDDVIEDPEKYNTLILDVQGFELNVLKGATKSLNTINYVLTEINQAELYENCSLVSELDLFLSNLGFSRVETDFCGGTWGDALYIKDK